VSRATAACLFSALLVSGCTSDKVIGRYKIATCITGYGAGIACNRVIPTASAFAISIATPSASAAAGSSFPERALAAYINVLADPKMSPTAKDLRANLAGKLESNTEPKGPDDRTVLHRTIIVTVRKDGPFNPADRLEATDVRIEVANARFDAWDTLATAYTTINAGTVQFTAARGLTESLSTPAAPATPLPFSAALGGSQTDTRVETLAATQQAETLTADVEDRGRTLVIHRQGGLGVDLTGNTVVKVDMSFDGNASRFDLVSVEGYKDKKGKTIPPKRLKLIYSTVLVPPPRSNVTAQVKLTYTVRHVTSGDGTYEEKDDTIQEITSTSVPSESILIPEREFSPMFFGLHVENDKTDKVIGIMRPGREFVGMCFETYDAAKDFLSYLRTAGSKDPSSVADSKIGFNGPPPRQQRYLVHPLAVSDISNLQVQPMCIA